MRCMGAKVAKLLVRKNRPFRPTNKRGAMTMHQCPTTRSQASVLQFTLEGAQREYDKYHVLVDDLDESGERRDTEGPYLDPLRDQDLS